MKYCTRIKTPAGIWEIWASERGVTEVLHTASDVQAEENQFSRWGAQELQAYFAGTLQSFSVPLDLNGTPFQKQVWELLQEIPWGTSVCYSDVAIKMGRLSAVRAVAQAVGRNPCLIMVPCHRVLGKDGSLTGFSAGLEIKKLLLNLEQIAYR